MKTQWKPIVVTTIAVLIGASALAFAHDARSPSIREGARMSATDAALCPPGACSVVVKTEPGGTSLVLAVR